jgi:TrmH family RNA methyltransferase
VSAAPPGSPRPSLAHVDVVLVRPQQPGNVGAAARAIANHGLGCLVLVDPPSFDPDEARWMAPHARHVVDGCRIVGTLTEAVADRTHVVGTSGRPRRATTPVWSPAELAEAVALGSAPAAIVFGPEDAGLSNEDLAVCTAILTLPTDPVQPSLNLGQAVTVTGSWLLGRVKADQPDHTPSAGPQPAPVALREAAIEDTMEVLEAVGYLRSRSAVQVRGTLHEGLARVAEDARLVAILRGMLKPVRHALGVRRREG